MPIETLVMVPPILCDARVFNDQIRELGRDHAVMFAPTTFGERMEEIASQILTWAPSKFALAGMGMGGMVAMEMLRRAPERVTRIALINTMAQPDTPETAAAREAQIIAARAGRMEDVMQSELNPAWLAPDTDRPGIMFFLSQMAANIGAEGYVKQTRAMQRRKDQQATLRKIEQPAVVICGQHDGRYSLKRHEFMAELIPNGALKVIDEAGHLPTLETPEAVTQALKDWMRAPLVLR